MFSFTQPSFISIHAPAKGATWVVWDARWVNLISIHAPAKGATSIESKTKEDKTISIHAPAKGATLATLQKAQEQMEFQSTLPQRERRVFDMSRHLPWGISIHAPAKGATLFTV